jgi:hypothetical protein
MNTTTHLVAPEEIMAWLDGELSGAEASNVAAHLDDCAECANLAAQFRSTAQSLSCWSVPEVPSQLEGPVTDLAQQRSSGRAILRQKLFIRSSLWTWKQWAIAGGCTAIVILLAIPTLNSRHTEQALSVEKARTMGYLEPRAANQPIDGQPISDEKSVPLKGKAEQIDSLAAIDPGVVGAYGYSGGASRAAPAVPPVARVQNGELNKAVSAPAPAPMIARAVSLTITVKDFATSRSALDNILARHQGYSAQLTVSTPENAPRSFQASLRIPAPDLAATLTELRALGRVQNESQSGEEVTQQHTDLVARLKNSRETEERLQAILQQRTGKVEEVLQVEEEIERVRGEIEGMEADQKALEHRVDFASVELQLTEEFKAQFNTPEMPASTRMHNAFVAGLGNASATLLGILLFFEEYGPVLLIWLAILGVPALLVWHRYRRINGRI